MVVLVCALTTFLTGCSSGNDMPPSENEMPTKSIASNNTTKTPEKNGIVPEATTSAKIRETNNTNLNVRKSDENYKLGTGYVLITKSSSNNSVIKLDDSHMMEVSDIYSEASEKKIE